uniref:Replication factor A protein 3 n=1 Tax=Glossina morsitans morsitans TaxID=37546 RepID=A0A1B0G0X3_GLOMM
MVAFTERTWVNGSLLKNFIGENVSIFLCVKDEAGANLIAISSDNQTITVKISEPSGVPAGDWIELQGKVLNSTTIQCKDIMSFGGEQIDFDKDACDMMAHFVNNCKDIFACT